MGGVLLVVLVLLTAVVGGVLLVVLVYKSSYVASCRCHGVRKCFQQPLKKTKCRVERRFLCKIIPGRPRVGNNNINFRISSFLCSVFGPLRTIRN